MQHQQQQPDTCCSKLLPRRWWCAQIWSSNNFFLLHHQSITYPLKMGDSKWNPANMEERGESQQNNASRISCVLSTTAKHAPRRPSRAPAHQESPQRNATCGRNQRTGALPDRRSAGAPDFRSVVPSPEKLGCCGLWDFGPRTAGYQMGILWEEDPSCGVCLNHNLLHFENWKAKIVAFVDFCLPNFCWIFWRL